MHHLRSTALALPLALVLLAGCGDGSGSEGSDEPSTHAPEQTSAPSAATGGTDAGSTPCDLLSEETLDAVTAALEGSASETGDPVVGLFPGQESFVSCSFAGGMLNAGVRGFDDGRTLLAVTTGSYADTAPEPLTGVGDAAYTTTNSYDGIRVTAQVGDDLVMVDSQFADRDDPTLPADLLVDVARELSEGVAAADVPLAEVPDTCPEPDDSLVTDQVGEVRLARGSAGDAGVVCSYVGDGAVTTIAARTTNLGLLAMGVAEAGPPVDVDGNEVYVVDEQAVLVASDTCAVTATREPLGWALAGTDDEDDERQNLLDLVAAAYERLGCS